VFFALSAILWVTLTVPRWTRNLSTPWKRALSTLFILLNIWASYKTWAYFAGVPLQAPLALVNEEIGARLIGDRVIMLANVTFANRANSAGIVTHYTAYHVEMGDARPHAVQIMSDMNARISRYVSRDDASRFSIAQGESQWFTIEGPTFSKSDFDAKFITGKMTLFYAAKILFKNSNGESVLPVCFFSEGKYNTNFVCPKQNE
jgi:hypothetical protein